MTLLDVFMTAILFLYKCRQIVLLAINTSTVNLLVVKMLCTRFKGNIEFLQLADLQWMYNWQNDAPIKTTFKIYIKLRRSNISAVGVK